MQRDIDMKPSTRVTQKETKHTPVVIYIVYFFDG